MHDNIQIMLTTDRNLWSEDYWYLSGDVNNTCFSCFFKLKVAGCWCARPQGNTFYIELWWPQIWGWGWELNSCFSLLGEQILAQIWLHYIARMFMLAKFVLPIWEFPIMIAYIKIHGMSYNAKFYSPSLFSPEKNLICSKNVAKIWLNGTRAETTTWPETRPTWVPAVLKQNLGVYFKHIGGKTSKKMIFSSRHCC